MMIRKGLLVTVGLMTASAAYAEDVPSNAELFRMLKDQQQTIARQQQTIADLQRKQARYEQTASVRREPDSPRATAKEATRVSAPDVMAAHVPVYTKAPAASPVATPNRFTVTGEYLALKAGVGDTGFVLNAGVTSVTPIGTKISNDPDFNSAYRVGVGYEFGGTNRAINASYTHLGDTTNKAVAGTNLWATVGRPDLTSSFENYSGSATSSIRTSYDRVDVLFSEPVKWFDARVALLYGLEYAKIRVNENIAYNNPTFAGVGVFGSVSNSSSVEGIGPQIGASVDYDLLRGSSSIPGVLSVNAVSTGSILYAKAGTATVQSAVTGAGGVVPGAGMSVADENSTTSTPSHAPSRLMTWAME
jgi:hypothetical protein